MVGFIVDHAGNPELRATFLMRLGEAVSIRYRP